MGVDIKDKKFSRSVEIEPILVYEAIMYGQKVTIKRYPSNVPVVELPYIDDTAIFSKGADQYASSK